MGVFSPTEYVGSIHDINFDMLKSRGIKVVALDIDNTLAPTGTKAPASTVTEFVKRVKANGFTPVLVSNNSKERVDGFNESLRLFARHRAMKPLKGAFKRICEEYNVSYNEICLVGDQIFTDIMCANYAGMMSILVIPLSTDEGAGVRMKRYLERAMLRRSRGEIYCLIGNPVSHSKSAVLHTAVYDYHGINARYLLCLAHDGELGQMVEKFKNEGVKGFNITVPFKLDIMPFLDFISDDAQQIGAVNTVKIENGKCYGYNTDGAGFVMSVKANGTELDGKDIKIIGAGGSTKAIVHALAAEGVRSIKIYNRTVEKAVEIADSCAAASAFSLNDFNAGDCDVLVNTTSVGLSPNCGDSPIDGLDGISASTAVYDIIYSPPETAFMKMARDKGCKAYNGAALLIYQGLIADEIWFGRPVSEENLVKEIERKING